MISILCVDDDLQRLNVVKNSLQETKTLHSVHIDLAQSVAGAKKLLRKNCYAILILDVNLPLFDNDSPSAANGLELLNEIQRRSIYNKPEHIIGITAHVDESFDYEPEFVSKVLSLIRAPYYSNVWLKTLSERVQYIAGVAPAKPDTLRLLTSG